MTGQAARLSPAQVGAVLDARLSATSKRPLTVALSGGGDSLALTLIADAWARVHDRPLVILTVDHRLQREGAEWTRDCADFAARLGRPFRALAWTGPKPTAGIPAAARAARQALLADAAREAGAKVLLLGHTADDILEARAMRAAGATTPDPHTWGPSPAWPEGRGLFLLRPLLGIRRAALRTWLSERDETWIDDPANSHPSSLRARVRLDAANGPDPAASDVQPLAVAAEAMHVVGIITLSRRTLRALPDDEAQRFVALAAVCTGGGDRRPATSAIQRAANALRGQAEVKATLAGARLEADDTEVRIFREAGEMVRRSLAPAVLEPGRALVWDGRFELAGVDPGDQVCRLFGLARRLPPDQQAALRTLPAAARGGLPVRVSVGGLVTCPALTGAAFDLIPERLAMAAGLVAKEVD